MTSQLPEDDANSVDLERLRTVTEADVFKTGQLAAKLIRTPDGVEFSYLPEWIEQQRPAVATTLPVNDQAVLRPGGALRASFAGLLPEGRRLGALRRAVKTSADDELSLLLAVGADAVGDVQVVQAGTRPEAVPPRVMVEHVGDLDFAELLIELGIRTERIALPGVQDKTSAAMLNVPISRAGERYILKLNPREYPHLVENEAFFLRAAKASGLTVAGAEVVTDATGKPGLLVRRFDRITTGGTARSLGVEDGCQLSGRPPADKYLVDTEATFTALAAVCQAPTVASRDLIRQLAFAYLTGNGDAHAKNFSVLQGLDGEWRPSPVYDIPSSQPYGDSTMALSLGGRSGGDFGGADFVTLGSHLGVPERATRRVLTETADRVGLWIGDLDELPFDRGRIAKLRRVITYRQGRLRQ